MKRLLFLGIAVTVLLFCQSCERRVSAVPDVAILISENASGNTTNTSNTITMRAEDVLAVELIDDDTAIMITGLADISVPGAARIRLDTMTIPSHIQGLPVTAIRYSAFRDSGLTSVVFPDTLTHIGNLAFQNNRLTAIIIPDSVTHIGWNAFEQNRLVSLVISGNIAHIESGAFRNNRLTSIVFPDDMTHIPSGVFPNNHLTNLVIPDGVTHIGGHAFIGNPLTSIVIPGSVTHIGESAFNRNYLTSVVIPTSVTYIGRAAFENNRLTSVVISDGVIHIGGSAFARDQLNSVTIPGSVSYIGGGAFRQNELTDLELSYGVTIIGASAFAGNQLSSVTIPDSVVSIRAGAFAANQLTEITVPKSVLLIGDGAFEDNLLTEVTIPRFIPIRSSTFDSDVMVMMPTPPAPENEILPAIPATIAVSVNGRLFSAPAWNVAGTSYFHLRDIAYMLNGTRVQFDLATGERAFSWQPQVPYWAVRRPYIPTGTEMRVADRDNRQALLVRDTRRVIGDMDIGMIFPRSPIFSSDIALDTIQLDGQSYFSLASFERSKGFDMIVNPATGAIVIDTREPVFSEYGLNAAREFLLQYRTLHDPDAIPDRIPLEEGPWPRLRLADRITGLQYESTLYRGSSSYIRSYSLLDLNRTGIPDILLHTEVVISGNGGNFDTLFMFRNGRYEQVLRVGHDLLDDGHGNVYFTSWHGDGITLNRLALENDSIEVTSVAGSFTPDSLVLHRSNGTIHEMLGAEFEAMHREGVLGNLLDDFPEFALYMERRAYLNHTRALDVSIFELAGE